MGKNSIRVNLYKTLKVKELKTKPKKIKVNKQPLITDSSTFQRPQPEPGMKEEVEDDNKMICVSIQVNSNKFGSSELWLFKDFGDVNKTFFSSRTTSC
jgi:hypothetical protein